MVTARHGVSIKKSKSTYPISTDILVYKIFFQFLTIHQLVSMKCVSRTILKLIINEFNNAEKQQIHYICSPQHMLPIGCLRFTFWYGSRHNHYKKPMINSDCFSDTKKLYDCFKLIVRSGQTSSLLYASTCLDIEKTLLNNSPLDTESAICIDDEPPIVINNPPIDNIISAPPIFKVQSFLLSRHTYLRLEASYVPCSASFARYNFWTRSQLAEMKDIEFKIADKRRCC